MDFVFHGVSASILAYALGERNSKHLMYAALVGISPDALWGIVMICKNTHYIYALQHSLLINLPLCLFLCYYNWKIAFGGMLHIGIDVFTHNSSTMYLFYPFTSICLPIGINWWQGAGLYLWAVLWGAMLICLMLIYKTKDKYLD